AGTRQVRDGLGRLIAIPKPVKRIVSLAPSSTEIVYTIGAGELVVGVDRYSDWPPAARALPMVGADTGPSVERILALKPDVVFTATSANPQQVAESLEHVGVKVFVSRANSLADIYGDIAAIGEVVEREAAARGVIASIQARLRAVQARVGVRPRVKALVVVATEAVMVAGRGSFIADMLEAAGGENVAGDSTQPFPIYSLERLLTRAPQVLVVGGDSSRAVLRERLAQWGGRLEHTRVDVID